MQHQLCPAVPSSNTRRRAAGPVFQDVVRTTWLKNTCSLTARRTDPRTVLTWIPVPQFLIRHVGCPYPADLQLRQGGTLKPMTTPGNPSYATAAGGVISTAEDLATWMRALVEARPRAAYHRQWLESPERRIR